MRQKYLGLLGACLLAAVPLVAQEPPPPPVYFNGEPVLNSPAPVLTEFRPSDPPANASRFWVRGEYLVWWVKDAPLPAAPFVTTDANNNTAALFNSDVNYHALSGVRFTAGGWFDPYRNIGLEGSFFTLQDGTRDFYTRSDQNGSPALAFSFFNKTPGTSGEYLLPITSPGQFTGSAEIFSTLRFGGTDINGVFCLLRQNGYEFIALAGFRYADLQESLDLSSLSNSLSDGSTLIVGDTFRTRNQFYGGQVGGRLHWTGERFAVDVTGKLALGATHQTVDIQGGSLAFGLGAGTNSGGFFAQPSNIGHYSANPFALMPALELKFSYQLTPHWRIFTGYDFMYWNQVVRPGSQVDRGLNLSQSTTFGNGVLSGPAYPMPLFNRSDFWAQGLTFGVELRF